MTSLTPSVCKTPAKAAAAMSVALAVAFAIGACALSPTLPVALRDRFQLPVARSGAPWLETRGPRTDPLTMPVVLPLLSHGRGMPYVEITIGAAKTPARMIVDTGAEHCIALRKGGLAESQVQLVPSLRGSTVFASGTVSKPVDQGYTECVEVNGVMLQSLPVVLTAPPAYETQMHGSVGLGFFTLWRWMSVDATAATLTLGSRADQLPPVSELVPLRYRGSAKHLTVPVTIDGIGEMTALIDTAATSDAVIGWSALVGPQWDEVLVNPHRHKVQTATSELTTVVGTLVAPMRIGSREFVGLRVLTIDDRASPDWAKIPLVLGFPFLQRLGRMTINFETMELGME